MIKLELSTGIFDKEHILYAVKAFQNICDVGVHEEGSHIICEFSNCTYAENVTCREFENYVIDLMNAYNLL
jgi:hypothetical protein